MSNSQLVPVLQLDDIGIVRDVPAHALPANAWSDGRNIFFKSGSVHKRKGHIDIFGQGSNEVISTGQTNSFLTYWPEPTNPRYIQVVKDTTTTPANLYQIYTIEADGTRTNVTGTEQLAYSAINSKDRNSIWQSTLFTGGHNIILNNNYHSPRYFNDELSQLTTIPDWNNSALTATANATHACKVIRGSGNRLIAGNITVYDGSTVEAVFPGTIRISSLAGPGALPTEWLPSSTNTADEIELSNTNRIQDIMPLQGLSVVYTDASIHTISFDGSGNAAVSNISEGYGALDQGCVIEYDGKHLVVGVDDIYLFGGHPGSIQSICDGRIRQYFYDNLHPNFFKNIFLVRDNTMDEVQIHYPTLASTAGECDEYLAWNYRNNTWTINELGGQGGTINGVYGPIPGGGSGTFNFSTSGVATTTAAAVPAVQEIQVSGTADGNDTVENETRVFTLTGSTANRNTSGTAEVVSITHNSGTTNTIGESSQIAYSGTANLTGSSSVGATLNGEANAVTASLSSLVRYAHGTTSVKGNQLTAETYDENNYYWQEFPGKGIYTLIIYWNGVEIYSDAFTATTVLTEVNIGGVRYVKGATNHGSYKSGIIKELEGEEQNSGSFSTTSTTFSYSGVASSGTNSFTLNVSSLPDISGSSNIDSSVQSSGHPVYINGVIACYVARKDDAVAESGVTQVYIREANGWQHFLAEALAKVSTTGTITVSEFYWSGYTVSITNHAAKWSGGTIISSPGMSNVISGKYGFVGYNTSQTLIASVQATKTITTTQVDTSSFTVTSPDGFSSTITAASGASASTVRTQIKDAINAFPTWSAVNSGSGIVVTAHQNEDRSGSFSISHDTGVNTGANQGTLSFSASVTTQGLNDTINTSPSTYTLSNIPTISQGTQLVTYVSSIGDTLSNVVTGIKSAVETNVAGLNVSTSVAGSTATFTFTWDGAQAISGSTNIQFAANNQGVNNSGTGDIGTWSYDSGNVNNDAGSSAQTAPQVEIRDHTGTTYLHTLSKGDPTAFTSDQIASSIRSFINTSLVPWTASGSASSIVLTSDNPGYLTGTVDMRVRDYNDSADTSLHFGDAGAATSFYSANQTQIGLAALPNTIVTVTAPGYTDTITTTSAESAADVAEDIRAGLVSLDTLSITGSGTAIGVEFLSLSNTDSVVITIDTQLTADQLTLHTTATGSGGTQAHIDALLNPLTVTEGDQDPIDPARNWPVTVFNLSREYVVIADENSIKALGFGYNTDSYVTRSHLSIDNSIENTKHVSAVQVLISDGDINVQATDMDSPGEDAPAFTDAKRFYKDSDYKVDFRLNGRLFNVKFSDTVLAADATESTPQTGFRISGYGMITSKVERRGGRQ